MTFDSRSMTFAAVFTLHVAEQDMDGVKTIRNSALSAPYAWSVRAENLGATYDSPGIWRASFPVPAEPPKRPLLMLPAPAKTPGSAQEIKTRRVRRAGEPRQYDLVIYNTERMPADYVRDMLVRVFRENAQSAKVKSLFQRHIHEGPYPRDAAETKAREVRSDAFEHGAPIPELRYVRL